MMMNASVKMTFPSSGGKVPSFPLWRLWPQGDCGDVVIPVASQSCDL